MTISTLVFDFGNVVGFFSHRKAAEQVAALSSCSADEVQSFLFGGRLEDDYEAGRLSTAEFLALVRDRLALTCADDEFALAFSDMFVPNPDVCRLLPLLKSRYRLLLLSNTSELHSRHFLPQFAEHVKWFDAVVLSHEVGCRKPDPRIYAHCQALAGVAPRECVFIDDLPANVEGARACGWHGVVYRRGDDLLQKLGELGVTI